MAGVLSGTSADGIDVALARLAPLIGVGSPTAIVPTERATRAPELLRFDTHPFPPELAQRLRAALDGEPVGLRETALLHRDLGAAFGDAVAVSAAAANLGVELVGSHGQTVWHHDGGDSGPATLQLGDGDFVAEASGAAVVSDFRQRDVALGGEGAPLSALADGELFAELERPAAILNLGGMANLTWLPAKGDPLAFDTGPAGSLVDGVVRRVAGRPFDRGGELAARGEPREELVRSALAHPFFDRSPPKSTGRDTFGEAFVERFVNSPEAAGAGPEDLLASAVAVVARSVAEALERFLPARPRRLVLAGGGVHNATLVAALQRASGCEAVPSDACGIPADAREALVFAILARRSILGLPSTGTSVTGTTVTGARPGGVLGKTSPAPPRRT